MQAPTLPADAVPASCEPAPAVAAAPCPAMPAPVPAPAQPPASHCSAAAAASPTKQRPAARLLRAVRQRLGACLVAPRTMEPACGGCPGRRLGIAAAGEWKTYHVNWS